jgi:hypothetical protein
MAAGRAGRDRPLDDPRGPGRRQARLGRDGARAGAGPMTSPEAEGAMRALGQVPLVMIRSGEEALDALLAARGYAVVDPTDAFAAPFAALDLPAPPRLAAIPAWPPLAIQRELWAEAGIGPARLAVMERASIPEDEPSRPDGRPRGGHRLRRRFTTVWRWSMRSRSIRASAAADWGGR